MADLDDRDVIREERHLALVGVVEQDLPRLLATDLVEVDDVGVVGEAGEAHVKRHVVLLAVDRAAGVDRLRNALKVGQEAHVERLDQTSVLPLHGVRDAGVNDVRAVARGDLGQCLLVVLKERPLQRRLRGVRTGLVLLPHGGEAFLRRVVIAGPREDLDRAVGIRRRVELGSRCRRARGVARCCGVARRAGRARARAAAGRQERGQTGSTGHRHEPLAGHRVVQERAFLLFFAHRFPPVTRTSTRHAPKHLLRPPSRADPR